MADPTHIRGDTFQVHGQLTGDFTGWTGASQVRDDVTDDLLSELDFEWVDASVGSFRVTAAQTENWPINKYVIFDVQVTSPSNVRLSTKVVKVRVERDATHS